MKLPDYIVSSVSLRIFDRCKEKSSMGRLLLNADCPLCNDKKQRLYIKDYGDEHMAFCHNCGYSNSFHNMLKDYFPQELSCLKAVFIDNLKKGEFFKNEKQERIKKLEKALKGTSKLSEDLKSYSKLNGFAITQKQEGTKERFRIKCINYLKDRRIPKDIVKDFWIFYRGPLKGYIGIPFWDRKKNNLIHIQGRMIRKQTEWEKERNILKKYNFLKDTRDENPIKIEIENKPLWGVWRIDSKENVIICEGTLDACAFSNSVATCGATLSENFITEVKNQFPKRIWCLDSFWHDKAGRELTKKLLTMGESCFIIPKECESKDPNDLLSELNVKYISNEYVEKNTYSGKMGLTKLMLLMSEDTTIGAF